MNFVELKQKHRGIINLPEQHDSYSKLEDVELEMMLYINKVVDMRSWDKKRIDVFSLHCKIAICESYDGRYDYTSTGKHTYYAMHSIEFGIEEFFDCNTDEEIVDTFNEVLSDVIKGEFF